MRGAAVVHSSVRNSELSSPAISMHLGDGIDGMRGLPDGAADVTITDPPYEAEAHTKQRRVKRAGGMSTEGLQFAPISSEQRAEASRQIARVTKRWALVFCQVEATIAWAEALTAGGLEYVRTAIWVKPDAMPQFTGDRPGMGYEAIVIAHRPGRKRWNGGGRTGVFVFNKGGGRAPGEPAPHPTTKPLPLMRELVALFSDEGETVLDPFSGSGTTGVACRKLGRAFIGWEIDEAYHAIAMARLAGEAVQRDGQVDLFSGVSR